MMAQHEGLPVAGYTSQSDYNVAIVNEAKLLEERVLRHLDRLVGMGGRIDQRMVELARTNIQLAFMWANRAVFQPGRVRLPEDDNGSSQQ